MQIFLDFLSDFLFPRPKVLQKTGRPEGRTIRASHYISSIVNPWVDISYPFRLRVAVKNSALYCSN